MTPIPPDAPTARVYPVADGVVLIDVDADSLRWVVAPTRGVGACRTYVSTLALVKDADDRKRTAPTLVAAARIAQQVDRYVFAPTLPVTWGSGRKADR